MRETIAKALHWFADRVKASPAVTSPGNTGGGFLDSYRRHRLPTNTDLLNELKNTAWTCASINAAVCAANPPQLYVRTGPNQPRPKCRTKALHPDHPLLVAQKGMAMVEEVAEHPLLSLLEKVNPVHNAFDLWELTELYLEIFGVAYWLIEQSILGIPGAIWILPSQNVRARRLDQSSEIVDWYEYAAGGRIEKYLPSEIIQFRMPNPRDPYADGMSPLKGSFEQVALTSQYTAMKRAVYENTGIPSVVISPKEAMGEEERIRMEGDWAAKFRKGGMAQALVASEGELKVDILSHSMGDLAALAEAKATKEDIANAFHVPIPYLTGDTNLANMEAAEIFHMRLAITPRLRRRDEKLNERLIPLYDNSGRLFLASEDPTPTNKKHMLEQQKLDLQMGVRSINEIRIERGMQPVSWGNTPFVGPGNDPNPM